MNIIMTKAVQFTKQHLKWLREQIFRFLIDVKLRIWNFSGSQKYYTNDSNLFEAN